jgi:parallel beta-helix repeat protein
MWSGRNTTIASNTFIGKGIMLGSYVTVAYNNFTDCDIAINMNGYNCTIRNNNFQNNQLAFHIYEGGYNQVYNNNFISNAKQAEEQHSDPSRWPITGYYTSTNNSWNHAPPVGGNYWNDYTGNDSNGDGFGDTAYHVVEAYYDHYPIVQATITVQPASEDLSPSETAHTLTGTISPTDRPQPAQTTNTEPSGAVPLVSDSPFPWTLIIVTFVIVSVLAVGFLAYYKNRPTPQKR